MSDPDVHTESLDLVGAHVEWYVPDTIVSRYATNLTVQRGEHDTVISFFEVVPPLIIGTPEEIRTQLDQLTSVRATCFARIVVANGRMPDFVRALQGAVPQGPEVSQEEGQDDAV